MKKTSWAALGLFAVLSAGLRIWQTLAGYEESGLARRGFLPGLFLPAVLLAAAAYFAVSARSLPDRRADALRLGKDFRFEGNLPAAFCTVAGSFLVMLGGGLYTLSASGGVVTVLLALFAVASAACVLYAVFALCRRNEPQGLALLVPICALVVFLVFVYRADATDPVLARTYVEILGIAALTLSAAQRAAFAFGGSSPRRYVPISAAALLLAVAAAAEGGGLPRLALFVGCAAVELGFLAAADFR